MIQNTRKDPRKPGTRPECRLSVILARDATVGVIFRRGPTNWTQVIRWNTATDTFDAGPFPSQKCLALFPQHLSHTPFPL